MKLPARLANAGRRQWFVLSGALASLVVAVGLYTRFNIDGSLSRDEGIYAYGGVQFSHGVAPYASIFDPKGPIAAMLAGVAASLGRLVGADELHAMRVAFLICAVLTVLAVYLLAVQLWQSVPAGIAAAVVFAGFRGFAADAIAGPDAKTPGILCAVVSMWLLARRQWFAAALVGSIAVLVWQPLLIYPLLALILAAVCAQPGRRWRALGTAAVGALLPIVVVSAYFVLAGAFGDFIESAVEFPLTGVKHRHETLGQRVDRIRFVVHHYYGMSGVIFWIGLILLVLVAAAVFVRNRGRLHDAWLDPVDCVVLISGLVNLGYALTDFQGYPDVFALLPYAALGFGGTVALVLALLSSADVRRRVAALVLAGAVALTATSWVRFSDDRMNNTGLLAQRASICAVDLMRVRGTPLYSLGDPAQLVIADRRNPDRFIYLGSGVDAWKVEHTTGGFAGWTREIAADHPSVVIVQHWVSALRHRMAHWLRSQGFRSAYVGSVYVFADRAARARAEHNDIGLARRRTRTPLGRDTLPLHTGPCGKR